MTVAIGYARVSTREQAESGLGLAAQHAAIRAECDRRGWALGETFADEGASGASTTGRPALEEALLATEAIRDVVLIAARLDRLARSIVDFSVILRRVAAAGGAVVALDVGVDTSTATGKMISQVIAVIAEFERDLGCERTRAALGAKRLRGERLGPKPVDDPMAIALMRARVAAGDGPRKIARALMGAGIPAPRGGSAWWDGTVRKMINRLGLLKEAQ